MEYDHLPRTAPRTEHGYRVAMQHWIKFLHSKSQESDYLPNESSIVDDLNQFATYLVNMAKKADGDFYSLGSVHQFLSGVKETIRKENPSSAIWAGHSGRNQGGGYGWYDEIRYAAAKAIVARVFECGGSLKDLSLPIGRVLLRKVVEALLKLGDLDSLETCAVLVYNYATVGRAGEAALSSWKNAFYNHDDSSAVLYCPMAKVSTAKQLSLYNDSKLFQLDPYFLTPCYWIIGEGKRHMTADGIEFQQKQHWVFPSMALKSNPPKLLNERIREACSSRYDGGTTAGSYNMTSIRDGAISFLMDHPSLRGPSHAVCRTGRDHTNVCSLYEYYWMPFSMQAQAGCALGDWSGNYVKHGRIPAPTIDAILNSDEMSDENRVDITHLNNFIVGLFDNPFDGLHPNGHLWQFVLHCFATFIMYFPSLEELVGHNNVIIKQTRSVAQRMDISGQMLRLWSKKNGARWKNDTILCQVAEDNAGDSKAFVEVQKLSKQVELLKEQNALLESKVDTMHDLLSDIHTLLAAKEHTPERKNCLLENAASTVSDSFPSEKDSSAGAEMNSSNESISCEKDEKVKKNAFHEMTSSSKRGALNLYDAHSINKVSVQQILIDYFQYHLHNNMNFDKTHDDRKNISLIRLAVKFAMHFSDKSVGGHDLRSAITAKPPESDSPHFITWKKARDDAAKKISDIAMSSMQNIERHIDEQRKKAKIPIKKKTLQNYATVSGLSNRINEAFSSGFFDKKNMVCKSAEEIQTKIY